MKNRGIVFIFGSIISIIIVCFFCLNKYSSITLDQNLLNKKWYHYDYVTGYYNVFYMDGTSLSYTLPGKGENEYKDCKKYNFNKRKNILLLDCGKKIQINQVNDDDIVLTIDSKKIKFYDNVENSLNFEFESYYNKSISEFKSEMNRVTELIKINYTRLLEIINSEEKSKIIFWGNNCTSVDCILALNVLEKWINTSENVHFLDINELKDIELQNLNKINKSFSVDKNHYNGIYPRVLIIENKAILEDFEIKCNGFNCSLYGNK